VNLFIVGDIHGCYYTFKTLLQRYWVEKNDLLIQVGDLIDRGNHTPQTINYCKELQQKHQAVFLKGNHEYMAIKHIYGMGHEKWYNKYGKTVLWQYHLESLDFKTDSEWMQRLPLFWENDYLFISHAGRSLSEKYMDEEDPQSILWNKSELKKLLKTQVIGHTPHQNKKPIFYPETNTWNVDTGAYLGNCLSALKLDEKGNFIDYYSVATLSKDIS